MTKRYYYTDPLAAAWMAKHYDMKFIALHTDEQMSDYDIPESGREFDWYDSCIADDWGIEVNTVSDAIGFIEAASDKIYIHPDSLHLLEPKEEDLLQGSDFVGYLDPKIQDRFIRYYMGPWSYVDLVENVKIIQRNGKAFMWPESEECD